MKRLLRHPHVRKHFRQATTFIISGLTGAVIEFSILKVLVGHYGLDPFIVYVPSSLIPAVFVFFFNRHVTFRATHGKASKQTMRFVAVYAIALVINYLLSATFYALGSAYLVGSSAAGFTLTVPRMAYLAKAMAIGFTAFFNYFFSNTFIFKKPPENQVGLAVAASL